MGSTFQHTPEPWHECAEGDCQCGQILGQNSEYICTVENPAARRRILACVNACAGLHTKVVQTIAAFGGMSQDTVVAAVLQEAAKATRELEALKARIKEEAYEAYWQASDDNRADRWNDTFDKDVRASFEKYWQENNKVGAE